MKNLIATIKVYCLNKWETFKHFCEHIKNVFTELKTELPLPGNKDIRLFVFSVVYLGLLVIGLYSVAFFVAFFYLFWLLDKNQ